MSDQGRRAGEGEPVDGGREAGQGQPADGGRGLGSDAAARQVDASGDEADSDAGLRAAEASALASKGPRCQQCGAGMRWDPEADALSCLYCGATRAVPPGEGTVLERPLESAHDAARGFGLELRVATCEDCGARVTFEGAATSTECAFCGSARVLDQAANRNALRPESLVPLDVSRAEVEAAFSKWLGKLWFRPNDLARARVADAAGLYLPYWTFDAQVHSEWTAMSGTYYWVTVPRTTIVNGKVHVTMQSERRTRWSPAAGERDDRFDDLLVPAGKGVSGELLAGLGGFDTTALLPYRADYLAGWRAEEYQLDLEQGWERGQELIQERQRGRCAGDVPGDTQRALRVHNSVADVRFKHVLLPVWSLCYRYGGKVYPVLVNGQSGRVAGKAPYSWVKILGAAAAVAAGAGLGALVLGS
ncbi:MAG: zinc ribbon domain-containing protein [Planctomycetota bacterium]|nr:MAG: zinc ribbon domain-containing protein [Planctomycetota bacterium]